MSEAVALPGRDRVIKLQIGGHEFGFRRPSRADVAEAFRRVAIKLQVPSGAGQRMVESDLLDRLDGYDRQWEARLEIGLRPRRNDPQLSLGETAPAHWLVEMGTAGTFVSFDNVDPDEFAAVVAYLDAALKKKEVPPSQPSSDLARKDG